MKLRDKVAIVTGAASGIGRAIALRFAKEGANIIVADINLEGANKVAAEIRPLNVRAMAIKTDVTSTEDVSRMVKATLDEFGKIDILVNNAGGSARGRGTLFHECPDELFDFVIDNNLKGAFKCSRAVLPHMMQRRSGKILSTASVDGVRGRSLPGVVEYSAVKAGIIGFTQALAQAVGPYGIRVNCFSPGPIATAGAMGGSPEFFIKIKERSYFGRLGEPDDVARVVAFLASDDADWITGQNIIVDGGDSLGWAR
jgi:NAD(P)-dependent dehydrogenase (short-subunit alcohol dehydrogenase family)